MKYKIGDWVRGDYTRMNKSRLIVLGKIDEVFLSGYYTLCYYYTNFSPGSLYSPGQLPRISSARWLDKELKPLSEIEKALYL